MGSNHKKIYTIILLFVSAFVLSWAIPSLVRMGTETSQRYPFAYYSSLLQDFAIRSTENGVQVHKDASGNSYTREQFDSITPLLSYRQLMLNSAMPDSILGVEIEPKMLRSKQVVWRFSPKDIQQLKLKLYSLFEAMSGRTNLESPPDAFRIKDKIEFVTIKTNSVNKEKSELFQQALEKAGFTFPAREIWGNVTSKRPYDEGYFILDNNNQLFHMKLVNGRPYVKNTNIGSKIDVKYVNVYEISDKSIYAFVFDKNGEFYTIGAEGNYELVKINIPPVNMENSSVMLMGNMFYWMFNVTTPEGCTYNVLDATTKKQHDEPYHVAYKEDNWDKISKMLFPVYFTISTPYTEFESLNTHTNFGIAFGISFLLSICFVFIYGRKFNLAKRISTGLCILIFGIPGLIAAFLIK